MEMLWIGGLAATPLAVLVALLCRFGRMRPATRHALWATVLLSFVTPVIGGLLWRPAWFRSDRVLAAADRVDLSVVNVPALVGPKPIAAPLPERTESAPVHSQPAERSAPVVIEPAAVDPWSVQEPPPDPSVVCADELLEQEPIEYSLRSDSPAARRETAETPTPPSLAAMKTESVSTASVPARPATNQPAKSAYDVAPRKAAPPAWSADVKRWLTHVLDVRDALAEVPPIPAAIWAGGALLLVLIRIVRVASFRRVIRRAVPAPAEILASIEGVAREIELRRVPRTLLTDERVSPMIWCGVSPVLVLPRPLWSSLDEDSRRAVIVHELAHLRRRDHVVCWIESIIGAVYWWHPVVWWARKRLRDEAEASCDAWVTSLLPTSRRAYAVALLATKSYLSAGGPHAGPALGVVSGRARKLARRITMVMTQRTAPRLSAVGALVAVIVLSAGAFVTPGLACPPEEQEAHAKMKAEHAAHKEKAAKERAVTRTKADKHRAAAQMEAEKYHAAEAAGPEFMGEAPALEAMRSGPSRRAPVAVIADGPTEPRSYTLPEGKLEALTELMARDDVPVMIERHADKIVVHATPRQHQIFAAFVRLIDPDSQENAEEDDGGVSLLHDGNGEVVVMAHEDVAATRERLRAAMAALRRDHSTIEQEAERIRERAELAEEAAEEVREQADEIRAQADNTRDAQSRAAMAEAVQVLRSRAGSLTTESDDLNAQLRRLEAQVEQLEREMEALEERVDGLEDARVEDSEDMAPLAVSPRTPRAPRAVSVPAIATSPLAPFAARAPVPARAPRTPFAVTTPVAPAAVVATPSLTPCPTPAPALAPVTAPVPTTPPAAPAAPAFGR